MHKFIFFKKVVQATCVVGINSSIVWAGIQQEKMNRQIYNSLSEDEQKKLYDRCPLNSRGSSSDGIAGIEERALTLDVKACEKNKPTNQYKSTKLFKS